MKIRCDVSADGVRPAALCRAEFASRFASERAMKNVSRTGIFAVADNDFSLGDSHPAKLSR